MARIGRVEWEKGESVIEWKIENFFELSVKVDEQYKSPSFSFANEFWNLSIYPNGETWRESEGHISLYLNKESSGRPIRLQFYLGVKSEDEYIEKKCTQLFHQTIGYGAGKFLSRSELLRKKSVFVSSDALTVVCRLKYPADFGATDKNNTSLSSEVLPKKKILEDLKQLLLNQEGCDVFLRVKEQEFPAHKAILQARSPVFASTFLHDMKEKATGIVIIEDCDPSVFPAFLSFLYCEDVDGLSKENMFDLFTVADKYEALDLRSKCVEFMKENLSVDTFCDTITLAIQHLESELIDFATDFFVQKAQEIIETVQWQSFLAENPTQGNELFIKLLAAKKNSSL